jgi:hypothetical protein
MKLNASSWQVRKRHQFKPNFNKSKRSEITHPNKIYMEIVYNKWQLVHGFMVHHNEVSFNQIFGGLPRQKP